MTVIFQKYMGTGLLVILFLAALLYLLVYEKRKQVRVLFVYVPVVVLLVFFNPLFFRFFYGVVGEEIYYRICWLLPITIVIAYAVIVLLGNFTGRKRIVFLVLVFTVLVISGRLVYTSDRYSMAENSYHVPQKVVDICDAIEVEGREVMAAFPDEFLVYVRQYTAMVCMPYGRDVLLGEYNELRLLLKQEEIEVERLARLAKQSGCHYVIVPVEAEMLGDMKDYSYEKFEEMHGYVIYKDTTMNFSLQ
uniref:hypothetical protein n=1 Tax=Acetatifactor sp. TaxID=1872090 RepID=UPI004056AF1E